MALVLSIPVLALLGAGAQVTQMDRRSVLQRWDERLRSRAKTVEKVLGDRRKYLRKTPKSYDSEQLLKDIAAQSKYCELLIDPGDVLACKAGLVALRIIAPAAGPVVDVAAGVVGIGTSAVGAVINSIGNWF